MARGKRRETIFHDADDRRFFLATLSEACAAYIGLNPVRAGMVGDPAEYRWWSSYGEAVGGGRKGDGKTAREGLVRACMSHRGTGFDAGEWKPVSRLYRMLVGLGLERKGLNGRVAGAEKAGLSEEKTATEDRPHLPEFSIAKMLRCRARRMRGSAKAAAGKPWSMRDLRVGV